MDTIYHDKDLIFYSDNMILMCMYNNNNKNYSAILCFMSYWGQNYVLIKNIMLYVKVVTIYAV